MRNIVYPYLPEGRTIHYVPTTHPWMVYARRVCAKQSTDRNHSTGSVIVRGETVLGEGGNQASFKNPTLLQFHREKLCIRRLFKVKTGKHYWLCPGCASPASHSEQVALRNVQAKRFDAHGADLYLWGHWWCCKPCWDAMIAAGIRNVYLVEGSEKMFAK